MGAVVEGDALPILGKSNAGDGSYSWWQVDTVIGPAWLFGEHVRAAGPLDGVPEVTAAPAEPPAADDTGIEQTSAASVAPVGPAAPAGLTLTIDGVRVTLRPARDSR